MIKEQPKYKIGDVLIDKVLLHGDLRPRIDVVVSIDKEVLCNYTLYNATNDTFWQHKILLVDSNFVKVGDIHSVKRICSVLDIKK